ncbi:MAG: response regulator [Deltaproteobacteria bacterium]|nr:response regulator [Deltaproteobacteria bacterium]
MKILLAEDDENILSIASLALERVGGHAVMTARDGFETLAAAETARPDLVLLDVMMPKLNGFDTCARLKADPRTRDIPVIFLSARAQAHEIQRGMSIGALGYILKPFDPMTLPRQIEEILKTHAAA